MILDFGTGYHDAQVQYMGLGWGVTLVSGIGEAVVTATIIGRWSRVIDCHGSTNRIETTGNRERIEVR